MATIVIVPSLAKKARVLTDTYKACSNERSKEDKYSNSKPIIVVGSVYAKV